MKQGVSLGFSQSLTLTPQLQQSIKLLQLSSQELEQEIEQQLLTNPFLAREERADETNHIDFSTPAVSEKNAAVIDTDAGDEPEQGEATINPADLDWGGDGTFEISPNDLEWGGDAPASLSPHSSSSLIHHGVEGDADPLGGLSLAQDLSAYLKNQALHLRLSPLDAASLDFLIDSLDERGFLVDSLKVLAESLSHDDEQQTLLVDQLRVAKQWLQNLAPAGIGAADATECLRLQVQAITASPDLKQVALQLLAQPLATLARRNIKQLHIATQCPEALIGQALALIARLELEPGRRFTPVNNTVAVPDVFIRTVRTGINWKFSAELNTDLMPRLKIDDITDRLFKLHKSRQAKGQAKTEAMQQLLLDARGFLKAIAQRFDTTLRVANAIVARQGQFLQHGAVAMRPLVLRDIARELDLHESTVSRVTTNKYMATPQGTLEFKYFFDASLGTNQGGETSGTAVRALLAQLIAAEKKSKPLSDGALADLLTAQGIECARRTVAKYREAMRIPTASLRRQPLSRTIDA